MKINRSIRLLVIVFIFSVTGIACHKQSPIKNSQPIIVQPMHITATKENQNTVIDAYDADILFNRAAHKLRLGEHQKAIAIYQKLLKEFPNADTVEPALYNLGLCFEQIKNHSQAALVFEAFVNKFPTSPDKINAQFRLAKAFEKQNDFEKTLVMLGNILDQKDQLSGIERVEALALKGVTLLSLNQPEEAKLALNEAVLRFKSGRGISPTAPVFHYSMAQFKLAELIHEEMRNSPLPADESILLKHFEHKAQLLLDAQRLYSKVIAIGHPHWAAAAAYKTGELYQHLWEDILKADPPNDLTAEEKTIYSEILRERIRVLLKKAISQWERTLKFGMRLNLENEWIDKTSKNLKRIRQILQLEKNRTR